MLRVFVDDLRRGTENLLSAIGGSAWMLFLGTEAPNLREKGRPRVAAELVDPPEAHA